MHIESKSGRNKEHLEMMKLKQACVSKGILKIHPKFEISYYFIKIGTE